MIINYILTKIINYKIILIKLWFRYQTPIMSALSFKLTIDKYFFLIQNY